MQPPIPILRSFNEAKAREFYIDFLGFEVYFEHRFTPDAPLYMGLKRGQCLLHVSEHHGDATPGTALRIDMDDVDAYCAELNAKEELSEYTPGRCRAAMGVSRYVDPRSFR